MPENLLARLNLEGVDPKELNSYIHNFYTHGKQSDSDSIAYGLDGEKTAVRVTFKKDGTVAGIFRGPDFDQEVFDRLVGQVQVDLVHSHGKAIMRSIVFCAVPIKSAFRWKNEFQILPVPDHAPQPQWWYIRARFVDLDQNKLPSVAEAKDMAKANYAAFMAQRQTQQIEKVFPVQPARPVQATANRYARLPVAHQNALVNRGIRMRVQLGAPQPTPTWVKMPEPAISAQRPAPVAPAPKKAVTIEPVTEPKAMIDLRADQDVRWQKMLGELALDHREAIGTLERHFSERLAMMPVEIDQRLKELNGLASRAGALRDPTERQNEISYLVAKRQRTLADEKDRQDKKREELRLAHLKEIEEARKKHMMLADMQQKVLASKLAPKPEQKRALAQFQLPTKPRDDLDR